MLVEANLQRLFSPSTSRNGFIADITETKNWLSQGQRRLAAIMFTDMVGYTALGQRNESLSLALVEEQKRLVRPILARHNGREVKTMGDAFLVEFPDALNAVRCAYDIQRATREFNFSLPEEKRIFLRVGVHLGDIVESQGDIMGDAVNIASRIEPLADDSGVCLTRTVFEQVENKFELPLVSLGEKSLKNVGTRMEVFRMEMPWQTKSEPTALDRLRIAVLPFANMSPDPGDEYFADGLTEELISTMSRMSELKVISRTSVMQYKDRPKSVGEIGRELRAGTILEGSVRKASGRVRITAQLVDSKSDLHLWSESYDKDLQDVFAIQRDIAKEVASALKIQLISRERTGIDKRPTENMDAYQMYLKGRYQLHRQLTKEAFAEALKQFEGAMNLDPKFALPYAGVSDYYHFGGHYNWFSPEEAFPKMKEYATRALELDPGLAEGHAALGAFYLHYGWKWDDAEREFLRAIELNPSCDAAYDMYQYMLALLGKFEESYEVAKRGSFISPQYDVCGGTGAWGATLAWAMLRLGRTEEGISRLREAVDENPELASGHDLLGIAYYRVSDTEKAIAELRSAVVLSQGDLSIKADLGLLLAMSGQKDEANSILNELREGSKSTYVSDVQVACMLYYLGMTDDAFTSLERAYERRSMDLPNLLMWFHLKELRSDPRWSSMEKRMGLTAQ